MDLDPTRKDGGAAQSQRKRLVSCLGSSDGIDAGVMFIVDPHSPAYELRRIRGRRGGGTGRLPASVLGQATSKHCVRRPSVSADMVVPSAFTHPDGAHSWAGPGLEPSHIAAGGQGWPHALRLVRDACPAARVPAVAREAVRRRADDGILQRQEARRAPVGVTQDKAESGPYSYGAAFENNLRHSDMSSALTTPSSLMSYFTLSPSVTSAPKYIRTADRSRTFTAPSPFTSPRAE